MRKLIIVCGTLVVLLILWMGRFQYHPNGYMRTDRITGEVGVCSSYTGYIWESPRRLKIQKQRDDAWNREHRLYQYAPYQALPDFIPDSMVGPPSQAKAPDLSAYSDEELARIAFGHKWRKWREMVK